jgi:hypothetical protein
MTFDMVAAPLLFELKFDEVRQGKKRAAPVDRLAWRPFSSTRPRKWRDFPSLDEEELHSRSALGLLNNSRLARLEELDVSQESD